MWCESGGIDDTLAADWRGVPARLAAVLQRGLTFAPADRWPSAAAFAQALWVRRRTSRRRAVVSVLVAVLLAATGKVWWPWVRGLILTPAPAIPDVSFGTCAPDDPGARLRMVAYDVLRNADGVSLARLIDDDGASPNTAKHVVSCKVEQVDGGLRVALKVGTQDREVSGRSDEFEWNLGQRIALEILQVVKPEAFLAPACKPRSVESYNAFMQGQEAFRRDDWSVAIERFEEALGRDPEYWLAQRWSRRPITVDLAHLLGHHAANLAKEDSLLIAAELAPTRQRRWALYAEATSKNLFGAVAPLQYGGDLTHRGPLDGIPLDRGVAVLREARQRDPKLASIHDQLMWALVRAGHRDSAHAALQALLANAQSARDVDPSVFALIWAMRFLPMDSVLPGLVGAGQGAQQQMAQRVRLALSFDLAPYQVVIGRQLVDAAEASVDERAHGRVAAALGLMAQGRPLAGIALLDSAVATGPPDGGILATQVAMWRVLAASLGIDGVPDKDVESARSTLTLLARDSVLGGRAAWALALDAARRGDTSAARTLIAGIPPRDSALRAIAAAVGVGVRLPAQALALTARWRGVREETWRGVDEESSHLSEPFARAILHLRRADWYDATNEPELAERERRWHENSDFAGWLQGPIQAAEVDWVTGAYVRAREGARRVAAGDGDACADLRRVIDTLWAQAEPGVSVLRDEARAKAQVCS
jgi:tetratricopeptide (TPR) repeat protein